MKGYILKKEKKNDKIILSQSINRFLKIFNQSNKESN